jgi:hypothetical protein
MQNRSFFTALTYKQIFSPYKYGETIIINNNNHNNNEKLGTISTNNNSHHQSPHNTLYYTLLVKSYETYNKCIQFG